MHSAFVYAIRQLGPVMICPQCKGACRIGSPYWKMHLGQCAKCKVQMQEDVDAPRVAHRNALYDLEEVRRRVGRR